MEALSMKSLLAPAAALLAGLMFLPAARCDEPTAAERGKAHLLRQAYSPPTITAAVWEDLWKQWGLKDGMCEDTAAWWHLKKKKTAYFDGANGPRSARALMQFMMSPLNLPNAFENAEPDFKDIREYLLSIQPPKYPLPVDAELADR